MTTNDAVAKRDEAEEQIRSILRSLADEYAGTPFTIDGLRGDIETVDTSTKEERSTVLGSVEARIRLSDTRLNR